MKASDDKGFRESLRESCAGAGKQIALLTWPDATVIDATSRLSRVLAGELNPPPALIAIALSGPNPEPIFRWLERVAHVEVRPVRDPAGALRERACVSLVRVEEQLSLIRDELRDADEIERADRERPGMAHVEPSRTRDRRHA